MDLANKAAIVTGAGTGVGRATTALLAQQGCSVLVNYSRSKDAAEQVAEEARGHGVDAVAHRADVSIDSECRSMVDAAVDRFGHLDVLINNAGVTRFVPHTDLEAMSEEWFDRILAVNLKGPFFCTRAAAPALEAAGGGEVVMTSSVAGLIGMGSSIAYCASKAGLNNLVITLARALGPKKIRVNAVAPGFIDGEWLQQGLGDAYDAIKRGFEAKTALGAVCTPGDVALGILSILQGPDLVTGHVLPVEGGVLISI